MKQLTVKRCDRRRCDCERTKKSVIVTSFQFHFVPALCVHVVSIGPFSSLVSV